MKRNKRFIFASMIIFLAAATCQTSGNPISTPVAEQIQTARTLPTIQPISTVSAEQSIHTIFPSFSLPDPNTVCVKHYYYALSCLDSTGWHIYENEYDEASHPTSTIPRYITRCPDGRIYLVDDEIYQYQVEEDVLVSIGGWFDQGIIACGRGNDVWVSDYGEVRRFDGSTWTSYSVEDYFESHNDEWPDSIQSLVVAPNGNAWVTTDNTLATFGGFVWEVLTPPDINEFGESDASLVVDSNGVVWMIAYPETCCIDGQLLRFDGVEWITFPGPDEEMLGIVVDNQNRIWAEMYGNKIFTLNPDTTEWELRFDLEQFGLENEWELRFDGAQLGLGYDGGNRLHQMEFDEQGRLWVTTNYGLGIYDGATWTIYHSYTADLYMNDISDLNILGDGPRLPPLGLKPFGSIRGKLASETPGPFTEALVYICIAQYPGPGVCASQAENVSTDGSFLISNVPAGTYRLQLKISNQWYDILASDQEGCFPYCTLSFTVEEGKETNLGEIIIADE